MNRNSIRTKIKITTCCLAGAMVISGSSFVSNAASVTAGASNFTAVAAEAGVTDTKGTNPTAGVSANLSQYLAQTPETDKTNTGDTTADPNAAEPGVSENEAPVVKSEYADIGVSKVEDYVNIRTTPSTDGEVVGKLYSNSAVTVLGVEGEWYKIHSGNCEGYIKSEFVVTGDEELAKSIGTRVAIVNTDNLNIRNDMTTDGEVIGQVGSSDQLIVLEELDGWVKVATDNGEGYVSAEFVTCDTHYKVAESKEEEEARLKKEEEARKAAEEAKRQAEAQKSGSSKSSKSSKSSSSDSESSGGSSQSYSAPSGGSGQAVADYAYQFIGNPYVYGGTSLTSGADCSGFVMSVYADFGVGLPHSSSALRSVGYEVSESDMQPGDIVCYSGHVGIYIGGGTIVNASTEETGIKLTPSGYKSIITVRRIF